MPPDPPILTELFRRGGNREKGGPVFEDLGFRISTDNGGPSGDCAVLRIKCGDYCGASRNSCVLDLPHQGLNAERVLSVPVLTQVVRSMAVAWEPDWAVATSCDHRDLLSEAGDTRDDVGWVMYVSRQRGPVPPLPAPVWIAPVEDLGTLVVLTPERLTASNSAHVELGRRVFNLLDRAGLLQPVIPG
nr:immunity 52 family protein [Pyxidicoccus fallax]